MARTSSRRTAKRAASTVVAAATTFVFAAACSAENTNNPTSRALTPTISVPVIGFDGYARVDTSSYQTYSSYNGYRRAQIPEIQFTTSSGIRCRIGPNYPDYDRGILCWGTFHGTNTGANVASVHVYPYDAETVTMVTRGSPPQRRTAYSFLHHVDAFGQYETYLNGFNERPVDPNSYHLLEARQVLEVKESSETSAATSVCIVETEGTITCEIRPAKDGNTHGFQLSPQGSRAY